MENKIKVYVQIDGNKTVTRIESAISPINFTVEGWTEIDEGNGDKYALAQNNYLEKGLMDAKGRFNYKYDTELVELTEAEKEVLFPPSPPQPTETEKLKSDIDFQGMAMETQQSEIDYLKLMGGM